MPPITTSAMLWISVTGHFWQVKPTTVHTGRLHCIKFLFKAKSKGNTVKPPD